MLSTFLDMTMETVAPPAGGALLLNILHVIDLLDKKLNKTEVWHYFLEVILNW